MKTGSPYTLAIILRSTNIEHFRLMLHSVLRQQYLPAEVLYIGLASSGSAVVQLAAQNPLPLDVEQSLLWCTATERSDAHINWCVLETIARRVRTDAIVVTENDIIVDSDFTQALLAACQESTVVTAFPVILSPRLSAQLDEAAIAAGEPFGSWWQVVLDGIVGQTRHPLRIIPRRWQFGMRWYGGRELSSSALAFDRATLDRLVAVRSCGECRSSHELLRCAGLTCSNATGLVLHARLTQMRSHVFALAPVTAPQWSGPSLSVLDVRPVLRRHRLN
ncbi:MAG: hypothetical protein N2663_06715 [Chlorobi bacterium]|nr:hypothetical protein [Chlorobiota bacterium]